MRKKIQLFSLGGNEVSPAELWDASSGRPVTADIGMQWRRTVETCRKIADQIEKSPQDSFLITHGNGPQVGNILLRAEYSRSILHPLPLDVCGADTQGAMGYMLAQLANELKMRGIEKQVAETITQVVVDREDPAFKNPTKFIGPTYSRDEALERSQKEGWHVKPYRLGPEGQETWRRVVPSPLPRDIVELEVIETQLRSGMIPITVGGGGIPTVAVVPRVEGSDEVYDCNYGIQFRRRIQNGQKKVQVLTGVEAVVDKDLATALLAKKLIERARSRGEEVSLSLTIFTHEDGVKLHYQKPNQKDLRTLTLAETRALLSDYPEAFPPGTMGPKLQAVIQFLESGGEVARITKPEFVEEALRGEAGTTFIG